MDNGVWARRLMMARRCGLPSCKAARRQERKTQRPARLARYVELTRSGAAAETGLIVWPEYAVEAYLEEPSPTRDTVLRLADDARADLILGGPHYESSPAGTRYHNSAYLVRNGRLAGRYDKHRLVPGAEDDRFASLLGAVPTDYVAGRGGLCCRPAPLRVGTLLCFEAMFPELARRAVQAGAEILVNLSNDAWFGHPAPARQQFDIADPARGGEPALPGAGSGDWLLGRD